mgnify:CR=1 FL=1
MNKELTMKEQSKKNLSFNFKKSKGENTAFNEQKNSVKLFNCHKCGFHCKAISKKYVKGFEDDFIVQLISLHPEKPQKITDLDSKKLMNDGELIQEVTCGICGKPGTLESIPEEILLAFGFNVLKKSTSVKKINKKISNNKI